VSSATLLLAILAAIVGVAKVSSFLNGRKTERLKNAEDQTEKNIEAKDTSNRVASDRKFRNRVRDFFS